MLLLLHQLAPSTSLVAILCVFLYALHASKIFKEKIFVAFDWWSSDNQGFTVHTCTMIYVLLLCVCAGDSPVGRSPWDSKALFWQLLPNKGFLYLCSHIYRLIVIHFHRLQSIEWKKQLLSYPTAEKSLTDWWADKAIIYFVSTGLIPRPTHQFVLTSWPGKGTALAQA